ncbi:ABC transporter permease subunit [Paenibacillus sp. LMG 31458]|uniref:ABC transporter permease subunit n=2 Tax=Paenibacillus TaxID=44249 RepID=A0ABX1Z4I4_9BACL|nr:MULTISPECIES: ABC transporter permease subunit [Paenibacillus]NOU75277.1 ABC transporter permease subunit [Paenibacillus phytorum]NOU88288.1 ABC transporter permease subunit [Paenibacillus germinis]
MNMKSGMLAELWKNRSYYLMAAPGLAVLIAIAYLPYPGMILAFKNFNPMDGIYGSPWAGFENFKFFLDNGDFLRITMNTLWINFNYILWGTILAVVFALMLNELKNRLMKKLFQSIMFIPYFFSFAIVGKLVLLLFSNDHGLVNELIQASNGNAIQWYTDPEHWVKIIVSTNIWKNVGYTVIIYLAVITGIDEEMLEAASLDGASRLQKIRYILIPNLIPTIIILTLMSIGRIFFGDFALIYAIVENNGLLYETTDVIDTYIYRSMITGGGEYGMMTAVGLCQSVVGFIVVLGSNWLVKKYDKDSSLF